MILTFTFFLVSEILVLSVGEFCIFFFPDRTGRPKSHDYSLYFLTERSSSSNNFVQISKKILPPLVFTNKQKSVNRILITTTKQSQF
jgi:hypothetical protein